MSVTRGSAAIGLVRPTHAETVGSVMRAAFVYGAALVAVQGERTPVTSCMDTPKAYRHVPVLRGDDLRKLIPYDAVPVAIDLVEGAVELPSYQHPQRAFYVFGPEDGTLHGDILAFCRDRVMVPTRSCMNLAATVNVVLYDRLAKIDRQKRGISYSTAAPALREIADTRISLSEIEAGDAFRKLNRVVRVAQDALEGLNVA